MALRTLASVSADDSAHRAAYWPMPIVRAVPAGALALAVTFSADHSAHFGLVAFGWFGIAAGILLGAVSWLRLGPVPGRTVFLTQAVVTLLAGSVALLVSGGNSAGVGVRYLLIIVTVFTAVTGALELYSGVRSRRRFVASGDWIAVGAFTLLSALVFVLIPPGYAQTYSGPDRVNRVLDAAVVTVGALGAWAAIIAVYLVIAGLSAKWGTQSPTDARSSPSPEAGADREAEESENRT